MRSPAPVRVNPVGKQVGPPPHAPAHGYRHRFERDGVDLVFEAGLGVYVVVGLRDVFFAGDRYYRFDGRGWLVSAQPRGGWVVISIDALPGKLRSHRGRGPAGSRRKPGRGPK